MSLETIIYLILFLVAIEVAILGFVRSRRGQLLSFVGDLLTLGSGACLLLGIQSAVAGNSSGVLIFLALAGAVHLADVIFRLKSN